MPSPRYCIKGRGPFSLKDQTIREATGNRQFAIDRGQAYLKVTFGNEKVPFGDLGVKSSEQLAIDNWQWTQCFSPGLRSTQTGDSFSGKNKGQKSMEQGSWSMGQTITR